MRVVSLQVENFRAIRKLELTNLPDAIVVAGPNGCGKSSLFDAVRLLKSAYGQYHQDEWQWWFNEFQININRLAQEASRVLHDQAKPLLIRAEIAVSEQERSFLNEQAGGIIENLAWAEASPPRAGPPHREARVVSPTARRAKGRVVAEMSARMVEALQRELPRGTYIAELTMNPNGEVQIADSPVLELAFSMYAPEHVGVIDYHGPHRSYGREQVGGINLNIDDPTQKNSQHALYNTQNKYSNVESEMARSFVRQLLAKEAGISNPDGGDLIETLHELFDVFFPGKKFLGAVPTPDGGLSFPVRLETGREHDINELSSGEKEVLLGYLRLRNNAPKNSIILLDEPELHLNPRLIRGLPQFYQKHLGAALQNQLWLITHSDTLLREAVEEPTYAVLHMEPAHITTAGANQVHAAAATAEVERALIDLVGDLATFSPRSKAVLLEGGGESEFDLHLVQRLFPTFSERVNLISGGSKRRVREMHDLLDAASREGKLSAKFYSITDRDFEGPDPAPSERRFTWDVYHVENYLLEPMFIRDVMGALEMNAPTPSESEVEALLRECAKESVDNLVRIQMKSFVNSKLIACIRTDFDPVLPLASGFRSAAERSRAALDRVLEADLRIEEIYARETRIKEGLTEALVDGRWKEEFRGRDVLQRFAHRSRLGIAYERLRNLIASRMSEAGYQPSGMKRIVDTIIENAGSN